MAHQPVGRIPDVGPSRRLRRWLGRPMFAATFRALLDAVEAAPPVDAVDVLSRELARMVNAVDVSFLIANFSGDAALRFMTEPSGPAPSGPSGTTCPLFLWPGRPERGRWRHLRFQRGAAPAPDEALAGFRWRPAACLSTLWRRAWVAMSTPRCCRCTRPPSQTTVTSWPASHTPARYLAEAKLISPLAPTRRVVAGAAGVAGWRCRWAPGPSPAGAALPWPARGRPGGSARRAPPCRCSGGAARGCSGPPSRRGRPGPPRWRRRPCR